MKSFLLTLLLGYSFEAIAAVQGEVPTVAQHPIIAATPTELGEVYSHDIVRTIVSIRNSDSRTIEIDRVAPRYVNDKVESISGDEIAGNGVLNASITLDVAAATGRFAHYFDVYEKRNPVPIGSFALRGFADWLIDPASLFVDFGAIDLERGVERRIDIALRPGISLSLKSALSKDPRFEVAIGKDGRSVLLKSRKDAPLGMFDSRVRIQTDSELQEIADVHLRGQINGRIVPDSNPVDFGLIRVGQEVERKVRLESIEGKPVHLGRITTDGSPVDVELLDCIPAASSCKLLRMKLPKPTSRDQISGVVSIEMPDQGKTFPLRFGAIVIGENTQVRDLDSDMRAAAAREVPISSLLKNATTKAPEPVESPTPQGSGPLLKWQTVREKGIYGYEVYRSTASDGPFARVNDSIIRVLDSDGDIGSAYRWRDTSADAATMYWYYIGIVHNDGKKSKMSDPFPFAPKSAPSP